MMKPAECRWDHQVEKWRNPKGMQAAFLLALIVVLMGAVASIVYATGGTTFSWLHLMYIPVLLAAAFFFVPGGLVAGIVGGLVLGPAMPLSVPDGVFQETGNWLFRTFFFVMIGVMGGILSLILNNHLNRIKEQAYSDNLTGLPNLLALETVLADILARRDSSVSLAMITFSNFASIMDALTYRAADALALQLAERLHLANGFRFPVYKIHSSSFSFIAMGQEVEEFSVKCRQILHQLQEPFLVEGVQVSLNMHCGVAFLPRDGFDAHQGIQKASVAAHDAESRNKLMVLYDNDLEIDRRQRLSLLGNLSEALKNEELSVSFQPKLNVQTGVVEGAEALLRWNHPEHGPVSPDQFIPEAEKTWLVQPMSFFAVKAVLATLKRLQRRGISLRLGVNLTAHNIQSGKFIRDLKELIDGAGITPGSLEIEITERILITDLEGAAKVLNSLKKRGVSIAIDDMGTGYSVIRYLQELPITSVKIDQVFIRDMLSSESSRNIISGMIAIIKRMGLTTVAEGVEDREVSDALRQLGCDIIQGYYVGRPMPETEFDRWLEHCPWPVKKAAG